MILIWILLPNTVSKILDIVRQSLNFVGDQIKERTRLGNDGRFHTTPEYPEFVWKEIIINAIAHRDYSIKGTDIQIKMFDDHITVESPGTLPGIVRLSNIRTVHFSRNPKIARFLQEYDYVKEFGEGEINFDKNELLVYNAIAANPTATRSDLIEMLDISARTIDRAIKSLKEKSAIERIGSKKTGYWSIITK